MALYGSNGQQNAPPVGNGCKKSGRKRAKGLHASVSGKASIKSNNDKMEKERRLQGKNRKGKSRKRSEQRMKAKLRLLAKKSVEEEQKTEEADEARKQGEERKKEEERKEEREEEREEGKEKGQEEKIEEMKGDEDENTKEEKKTQDEGEAMPEKPKKRKGRERDRKNSKSRRLDWSHEVVEEQENGTPEEVLQQDFNAAQAAEQDVDMVDVVDEYVDPAEQDTEQVGQSGILEDADERVDQNDENSEQVDLGNNQNTDNADLDNDGTDNDLDAADAPNSPRHLAPPLPPPRLMAVFARTVVFHASLVPDKEHSDAANESAASSDDEQTVGMASDGSGGSDDEEKDEENDSSAHIPRPSSAQSSSPAFSSPPPAPVPLPAPSMRQPKARPDEQSNTQALFKTQTPTRSPRGGGGGVSRLPFAPLTAARFGLVQEELADDPFWLLIVLVFLSRVSAVQSLPVFWAIKAAFPTPDALADASPRVLVGLLHCLGMATPRCTAIQRLAREWLAQPPQLGVCTPVKHYPRPAAAAPADHGNGDGDGNNAWEIGHLAKGAYTVDAWRIFCRDALLGRGRGSDKEDENGNDNTFQPEWMRVVPQDKELRAYLRWRWMKEGWDWDPQTGARTVLREELRQAVNAGRVGYDDRGQLQILEAPQT